VAEFGLVTLVSSLAALSLALGGGHVALRPVVAAPDGMVYVTLSGVKAPGVQMKIEGGLASLGRWFDWVALRQTGPESWRTVLRAPGFLGVYPLQVRVGSKVVDAGPLVRILPRDFAGEPAFFTPLEVAEWWAQTAPSQPQLLSTTTWHAGFFTHRDSTLNRLLRLRVRLAGRRSVSTLYLSIARLTPTGPWRLLETVSSP